MLLPGGNDCAPRAVRANWDLTQTYHRRVKLKEAPLVRIAFDCGLTPRLNRDSHHDSYAG